MGEETEASPLVTVLEVDADATTGAVVPDAQPPEAQPSDVDPASYDRGRHRFAIASLIAAGLAAVPFLWVLWSLWGPPTFLRTSNYQDNFYDLQTRAMFHGHLSLANGALGIEGFIHDGRTYTYFGLFPSLLRMPILAVTSSLDGRLTAPFIMLAWMTAGLFSVLLLWRVRVLVRGRSEMGWAEAFSFGVLTAVIMGGSVWLLLAATPYVFAEDLAWSICLTVGSLFALLGVLERPTWGRVIASFILILFANLDRVTTGWACVGAAVLIAVWFGLGRGGQENRRWLVPMLAAGLIPLVVACVVNYAKFGVPFGVSNFDQVWTKVNAYRRRFLAANHNSEYGPVFIPTTLLAYLKPDGLRLSTVFPYIGLPAAPPETLSGVLFDRRYRTASLPASMPFLFLLSCWGLITAFRPKPIGQVARTRILLIAAVVAGTALFIWGYIAPRYLADFMPLLVLASGVAMVDIWRRLEGKKRSIRYASVVVISLVALFTAAANVGIAIIPNEEWSTNQVLSYVQAQNTLSAPGSLHSRVVRGASLPPWAPADELYVVGNCDGLYISTGENYSTVPSQQFVRTTWMVVERGPAFQHTYSVTFHRLGGAPIRSVELVQAGSNSIWVSVTPTSNPDRLDLIPGFYGTGRPLYGDSEPVSVGSTHRIVVITDPDKHQAEMFIDGVRRLNALLVSGEPIVSKGSTHTAGSPPTLSAVDETGSSPGPTLCEGLKH